MARKKRGYVPKVKGCYECSQRRIDCDNTHPHCKKCDSKGLSCSGFGVKYRFRDGLRPGRKGSKGGGRVSGWVNASADAASSLTLKPSDAPVRAASLDACIESEGTLDADDRSVQATVDWGDVEFTSPNSIGTEDWTAAESEVPLRFLNYQIDGQDGQVETTEFSPSVWDASFDVLEGGSFEGPSLLGNTNAVLEIVSEFASMIGDHDFSAEGEPLETGHVEEVEFQPYQSPGSSPVCMDSPSLSREIDLVEPSKLFLLRHFSEKIAPEMVVIDGQYNGWRHLILPIALTDDLVMSAVLAASAFHISGNGDYHVLANPRTLYVGALRKLQQRRELTGYNAETKQMIILAIVVLLVVVMINGCSDFPVMFRMLQSAIDAIGGENGLKHGGEVAEFSLRQIRKMKVYAAPLLSQDDGLRALMSQADESFDCLTYYTRLYPEYAPAFDIIANLRRQAFNIYLQRVLCTGEDDMEDYHSQNVETFLRTLRKFPQGLPGEHILIWSCFIAASESRDVAQQQYFRQFFSKQYIRNGFANIPKGLELLQKIWSSSNRDWPALLPEPQVFIM